jgi:probable HAF family extracellular repeat protein
MKNQAQTVQLSAKMPSQLTSFRKISGADNRPLRSRLTFVALLVLSLLFTTNVAFAAISFTRIGTPPHPIGIDYSPTLSKLILSVNYNSDDPNQGAVPNNFATLDSSGTAAQFSIAKGIPDEAKVAVVQVEAAGFHIGDVYCTSENPGEIAKISANGQTFQPRWATLIDSNGIREEGRIRGGLYIDRITGGSPWGNNLIITTTAGGVWKVNSSGVPTLITRIDVSLEGVITVPNDAVKYCDWAGRILAGTGGEGSNPNPGVWSIESNGTSHLHTLLVGGVPVDPEDIDIADSTKDFYVVSIKDACDWGLFHASGSSFSSENGKIILTGELDGNIYSVTANGGSSFSAALIAQVDGGHFEHACFAPINITPASPSISIEATDNLASEDPNLADNGTFVLTRTGDLSQQIFVNVSISGTARLTAPNIDYDLTPTITSPSVALEFPCGASSLEIVLTARADSLNDPNETAVITILSGTGYQVGTPSSATVNITDGTVQVPPVPNLVSISSAGDNKADESLSNTGEYVISRAGNLAGAIQVNFTLSGTAASGTDYRLKVNGNVITSPAIIPANVSAVAIVLEPISDSLAEGSETAVVTLSGGTGYTVTAMSSATVTIFDLPAITVTATSPSASESGQLGQFTFQRTSDTTEELTVFFELPIGTGRATFGSDYDFGSMSPSGITFEAGAGTALLTLLPIEDSRNEGDETVLLNLLLDPNNSAKYTIATGSATVTIADNDLPHVPVSFTITPIGVIGSSWNASGYGINNNSFPKICGDYRPNPSGGPQYAFRWQNGTLTSLGVVYGTGFSYSYGINDSGVAVGWGQISASYNSPLKFVNGSIIQLSPLHTTVNGDAAVAINNEGEIVGSSINSQGKWHAVLWSGGSTSPTDLGSLNQNGQPEQSGSYAYGIQNLTRGS